MFYSQFILAKKGPLGTIWIAAHLERKLRKNQVADTDIGVSVDSILFPDAPIALRLSSHLLLGVVRIYSKKVNYLFNDCSEALIKIKHAFRSTAVDLPPEESTAPYNSITLPENFDLDNFELPDSACLDSNFVDHHVSTREQITLQDTVNETAYPTSKFGLDERFGDEDASELGLDLDEELFIEKKISPKNDEASIKRGLQHGETSVPSTSLGIDVQFGFNEEKGIEIPNELSELSNNHDKNFFSNAEELRRDTSFSHRQGYAIQTPDLNEVFQPECQTDLAPHIPFTPDVQTTCFVEPTRDPSNLVQEPPNTGLFEVVPPTYHVPALNPREKAATHVELGRAGSSGNSHMVVEFTKAGNKTVINTEGSLEERVESGRPGSSGNSFMELASTKPGNETVLINAESGLKSGETAQEMPVSSVSIDPMPESLTQTYSNWNVTTNDTSLVSGTEYQQTGLTGNAVNNILTGCRFDNEESVTRLGFTHEANNLSSPPNFPARFENLATSTISTYNMDVSRDILDARRKQIKDGVEPSKFNSQAYGEDGDFFVTTSLVGSDFLPRPCSSNLHHSLFHSHPSGFPQDAVSLASPQLGARFVADNMDVSSDTSNVRRTQNKDDNELQQLANLGRVEDGDSCISSSVVRSDDLSRSCGSNLHQIFSKGDLSGFSQGAVNQTSPIKLVTRYDVEPVTSNICKDNMDVLGTVSDVKRAQKKDGESLQISRIHGVEGGDSCINTAVVGSDFLSRSSGSDLHPIFPHGAPSVFSREATNLTSSSNFADHFSYEAVNLTSPLKLVTQIKDNLHVFGGISDVESSDVRTQKKDSVSSKTANIHGVEDGDSCINSSVVGSDFLSRSYSSNKHPIFTHGTPSGFSQEAINLTSPSNLSVRFEAEPANFNICPDNMIESEGISNVKLTQKNERNEASQIDNLVRVEDGGSYISTPMVGSNLLPRSGGSNLHPSSSVLVDGALGEASELPLRDHSCNLKAPMMEEVVHKFRSSFEVQGEDLPYTNNSAVIMEGQQMPRCTPSDIYHGAIKRDELSVGAFSSASHLNHSKFSSTSEFLGPEKMLAPSVVVDTPIYHGMQAADKGVTESDGGVDRNSGYRKRRAMDSATIMQTASPAKLSGTSRSRNFDFTPGEDDVLAAILAGRTAPSSETKSIPSLSNAASLKRPRAMSKAGMHKRRRVLMDDSTVLHADAIRQQLIKTEDIRRMRKKAPCTRPETWKIYLGSMEDDIFDHSVLTGATVELSSLSHLNYNLQKDPSSQAKDYSSHFKTSGETASYRMSEFLNEISNKEMNERILPAPIIVDRREGPSSVVDRRERPSSVFDRREGPSNVADRREGPSSIVDRNEVSSVPGMVDRNKGPSTMVDGNEGPSSIVDRIQGPTVPSVVDRIQGPSYIVNRHEGPSVHGTLNKNEGPTSLAAFDTVQTHEASVQCDLHDILERIRVQPQVGSFCNAHQSVLHAMQPDAKIDVDSISQQKPIPVSDRSILSLEKLANQSINLTERSLHIDAHKPINTPNDVSANDEGATLVEVEGNTIAVADISESLAQTEIAQHAEVTESAKSSHTLLCNDGSVGQTVVFVQKTNGSAVVLNTHHAADETVVSGERPVTDAARAELDNAACVSTGGEHVPSTMGENDCMKDIDIVGNLNVDSVPANVGAARDSSEFCSAIDTNYTGFLNQDDEEVVLDEAENDLPNPENAQSLENSGWSARTRGVARYLKILFDEESGQGRKSVAVNHLVAGKTRKEASRMFFETLVLKTRDYIQVEQEKPFEFIHIKPRIKLLKSEF